MLPYLTQAMLTKMCLSHIDPNGVVDKRFSKAHAFRPDFVSHDKKVVIEFDGYQHYSVAEAILRDERKDSILAQEGYAVIRIPYFIQLCPLTYKHTLQPYVSHEVSEEVLKDHYPHGFHDRSAMLPANFNRLGHDRFEQDLIHFSWARDDILQSLVAKEDMMDRRLIYFKA
jgi:hypothetical protein